MDRRYVELIARNMKVKMPRKLKFMLLASLVFVGFGFLLFLYQKVYGYLGLYVGGVGFLIYIIAFILMNRYEAKKYNELMGTYDKTGRLPEWPER